MHPVQLGSMLFDICKIDFAKTKIRELSEAISPEEKSVKSVYPPKILFLFMFFEKYDIFLELYNV